MDSNAPHPHLRKDGRVTQLIVGNEPFLVRGGELGNSAASDPAELGVICAKLSGMHLNTVLLPVYWDRVEPREGEYDFSLVQAAIEAARKHDLRLVPLWFGTWKNSMSCYVPGWVKRDAGRFPRVRLRSGEATEIIGPTSAAARDADARAFAALMRWLKGFDGDRHTVVMAQVENEIGMIPEPRDYSAASEAAYGESVPDALLSRLADGRLGPEMDALWRQAGARTAGTWAEVFGADPEGEEVFSAWQFATYVEAVTAAGKREYPLPMLVNAALVRAGYKPGQYPSAGPLPHLIEVWQAGAPSVDMLSPDIYFPNFGEWARRYVRGDNPVFIPEMAASARVAGNALYAIGQLGAMGVAPFAIETTDKSPLIADCYRALEGVAPLVLSCQRAGTVICLSPEVGFDWKVPDGPVRGELGGFVFEATFDPWDGKTDDRTTVLPTLGAWRWEAPAGTPCGAAMILQLGPEEFAVLGLGAVVTFAPADGRGKAGIESVQAGRYEAGVWRGGRWLNGDETHQGRHIRFGNDAWGVQKVTLYRYD